MTAIDQTISHLTHNPVLLLAILVGVPTLFEIGTSTIIKYHEERSPHIGDSEALQRMQRATMIQSECRAALYRSLVLIVPIVVLAVIAFGLMLFMGGFQPNSDHSSQAPVFQDLVDQFSLVKTRLLILGTGCILASLACPALFLWVTSVRIRWITAPCSREQRTEYERLHKADPMTQGGPVR